MDNGTLNLPQRKGAGQRNKPPAQKPQETPVNKHSKKPLPKQGN
jgi:hypothetical protein